MRIKRFNHIFFRFLFFVFIVFITPNVFAKETNITNKIKATTSYTIGSYYAVAPAVVPVPLFQNVNTRYNGTLSQIEFYVNVNDFDWDYNKTYTMTMTMETDDWRNHFMGPQIFRANNDGSIPSNASNMYVSSTFKFISMKKIKFNFKIPSTMGPYIKFTIYSTNTANTAFTGVSNYKLNGIYISDNVASTPTPAPVTPAPTPTPQPNNQDIINNNTQNTENIINNNNQNTENIINNNTQNTSDIIENNNSNTQAIIDSNKVCTQYDKNSVELDNKYLDENGTVTNLTGFGISSYIPINQNGTLKVLNYRNDTAAFCFYDVNKSIISCALDNTVATGDIISIPSNSSFFRFSIHQNQNKPTFEYCANGQQSLKDGLDQLKDTMQNDDIDDKTGFFTNFEDDDHGLTSIITIPLSTIQSLTNSSCVSLSIPIPFTNKNVSLPCMTEVYQNTIPSIFNIWQVVSFGIISYFICIDIFKIVKGFKDPNEDKVEVLDL